MITASTDAGSDNVSRCDQGESDATCAAQTIAVGRTFGSCVVIGGLLQKGREAVNAHRLEEGPSASRSWRTPRQLAGRDGVHQRAQLGSAFRTENLGKPILSSDP